MGHGIRIFVELSSVNRKQLDLQIQIPRPLAALEPRVQEEIQKTISRGRISGEIVFKSYGATRRASIQIDEDLAKAYVTKLRQTARRLKIDCKLDTSLLLKLPDIVRFEQPPLDLELLWKVTSKALQQALRDLVKMRKAEGRALKKELSQRLESLHKLVVQIKKSSSSLPERYRKALAQRLRQAGLAVDEKDSRLARELIYFTDKSDIIEELIRLDSHFKQTAKIMKSREPAGRALDFLVQELLREINTVASKANDKEISEATIMFKAELERFREQIQNIE